MNRCKFLIPALILLCGVQTIPLFANEEDLETPEIAAEDLETSEIAVENLETPEIAAAPVHNQYLLENFKFLELADKSYTDGQYDDAVNYAREAIKYAQMSDDYTAFMLARERMDWAEKTGVPKSYPEMYAEAHAAFTEAQDAAAGDDWETAGKSARQVLAILSELPDQPVLPAQYQVQNWVPMRDCLWNIAGRPEIYGDPFKWKVIYDANVGKFPESNNPNLIEPGMILDIPSIQGEKRSGIMQGR